MSYEQNIWMERQFAIRIKRILGETFIGQDPIEDRNHATDFLTFTIERLTVAARLRSFKYLVQYPNDFTIRWRLARGGPTEIHKIRDGWARYMFYGFITPDGEHLERYVIADLDVFRESYVEPLGVYPNESKDDSHLAAWRWSQFPTRFIVRSWTLPLVDQPALWVDEVGVS